jgi:hypothetical protein
MTRSRFRVRYADVVATLALLLATGGTAYAATVLPKDSVGTPQLKDGAVITAKLHGRSVTTPKLARNAVRSGQIKNGSVSLDDLVGTDLSGSISFSLGAGACSTVTLGVSGARVDQVSFFNWTASTPAGIVAGPSRVSAKDHVAVPLCNLSGSPASVADAGVRIVTFG